MTTVSDALNKAIQYHQNGNTQEAERIYTEILKADPSNINCLYLMGLIYYQKGKLDHAVDFANKALSIRPAFDIYKTLADIYIDKREFDNAIVALEKAVQFDPDYVEGYFNIGFILQSQNQLAESIEYYKKAISIKPDYSRAYDNLGAIYLDMGDLKESLAYYEKSMYFNPNNSDVYFNIANIFRSANDPVQAIEFYQKSLQLKPNDGECYLKLGVSFIMNSQPDQAIEALKKAMSFDFNKAEVYHHLANVYFDKEDYQQAKEYFNKSIELNPDYYNNYNNLGLLYNFNNDLNKAIPNFLKALELNPNDKTVQYNLARAYIGNQNFEVGWDYFECRDGLFDCYGKWEESIFNKSWKNDISGKTIYVNQTGGFGDAIELIRYLPLLREKGAKVITKLSDSLKELFKDYEHKAEIFDVSIPDNELKYDARLCSLCLPCYFKTNIDTVPSKQGYLKPDPDKVKVYKDKYFNNDLFKLGIAWSAGTKLGRKVDDRNMELKHFLKLAEFKNIKLYSLQKGSGTEQLDSLPKDVEIVNLGATFENFADTAAAIENLDLLISIDTSIIHVAGAIGKKTWVMLPYFADWRFFTQAEDTMWYGSMKLYRQKEAGNWQEIIDRIYNDLKSLEVKI
jgi:tetratricopeptide (TPR) repeat protein